MVIFHCYVSLPEGTHQAQKKAFQVQSVDPGGAPCAGSTAAARSHRSSGAQGKDSDRFGSCVLGVLEGEGAGLCEEPR